MNKLNNKSIILSLGTLAIFALLTMPLETNAGNYVWGSTVDIVVPSTPAPAYSQNQYQNFQSPTYGYTYAPAAPVNYAYTGYTPTPIVYATPTVKKVTVAKAPTVIYDPNDYVLVPKNQLIAVDGAQLASMPVANPNLSANVVSSGAKGFMPSGILGWIFVAICIFIIVILVRKLFGRTENYLSTPLKHA